MLHVEILGSLAQDSKVIRQGLKEYLLFTVEHREMSQYLFGHNVPVVCKYPIKEYSLYAELKKNRRVLVKGDLIIVVNNGRNGDGSTSLCCRVKYIELI